MTQCGCIFPNPDINTFIFVFVAFWICIFIVSWTDSKELSASFIFAALIAAAATLFIAFIYLALKLVSLI